MADDAKMNEIHPSSDTNVSGSEGISNGDEQRVSPHVQIILELEQEQADQSNKIGRRSSYESVNALDFLDPAHRNERKTYFYLLNPKNHPKESRDQFLYLFLMGLVVLMLWSDQNLLAPSLTLIATEFNMTDEEKDLYLGGYLSIGFFISGGFSAILAGCLADSVDRKKLFSVVVIVGELSALSTLLVTDFWGLFITRFVTGFAMGGASPVLYSLVGDTFVDEWRGRATSLFTILNGAGTLVGQSIAALVAPKWGWRVPFAVVSIPAILATVIFYCCVNEPKRGGAERVLRTLKKTRAIEDYDGRLSWSKVVMLLKNRTVMLLFFLSIPLSVPWGFLLVYAQDFLMHDVGPKVGGISSSESLAVVISFAISAGAGTIISGFIVDHLWRNGRYFAVAFYAGFTIAIGAIPMYIIANELFPYYVYILL